MKRLNLGLFGIGLAIAMCIVVATDASAASVAEGKRFAVAAPNAAASAAAIEVLELGGNAVDAAIAAAFVVGVVEPQSAGLGGGGFALVRDAQGRVRAYDFRERAPAAADRLMYVRAKQARLEKMTSYASPEAMTEATREATEQLKAYHPSRDGGLSVAIPGMVDGLATMHRMQGQSEWDDLVEPAQTLAEDGFRVGYRPAGAANWRKDCLVANKASIWVDDKGRPIQAGQMVELPGMAKALQSIARDPDAFSRGWIAQDLVAAAQAAGGILTFEDLIGYKTRVTDALEAEYRGHTVYGMPLPSSGGLIVEQILSIVEGALSERAEWGSDTFWHTYVEASRLAFRDRALLLGDPMFVDVPVAKLRDSLYHLKQSRRITNGRLDLPATEGVAAPEAENTAHISVATADGQAVSMTLTINYGYGSCVMGAKSQILLNDEMDDFVAEPGVPNAYGLVGNANNEIAPGKTPLSSMSPTIITQAQALAGVLGAPGGPTIISNVAQLILARIRFQTPTRLLGQLPKVHHQWMPDVVRVERAAGATLAEALRSKGHEVQVIDSFGNFQAIFVEEQDLVAVSDPRGEGAAEAR